MKPLKPEGLETPGLVWQRRSKRRGRKTIKQPTDPYVGYWVCRPDILEKGYTLKTQRLWPPAGQPYSLPSDDDWKDIAASCQKLQSEMLAFSNGLIMSPDEFDAKKTFDGTVGSLVDIYLADPDSPFHKLRYDTRKTYRSRVLYLKKMVGQARITPEAPEGRKLTFRDFNRWAENWAKPKVEGGPRRVARAHGYMSFVRILFTFGAMSELPRCEELHKVLSKMEIENPRRRKQKLTLEQAVLIIKEAHRRGDHSIALAQALMTSFMIRQKDVVGEWIPISEPGLSAVTHKSKKWIHGLIWEEVNAGVLDHRLSKSLRGKFATTNPDAGKGVRGTLALFPLVVAEIERIPIEKRSGPMVIAEHTGRPWIQKVFAEHWREIARAVGVPDDVQNRDSRAGAASHAEKQGAKPEQIRPALGHEKIETTMIYLRNQDEGPDNIARIRFGDGSRTK
ncbi:MULTISPECIES: tyrosine-type recombinase/integrase [Bradyrhizobium]|uniref:Tyr recombinase domain-containing protein n=1 Tax=Bradyrhizobium retamae TaxID=1300035 RepID=A0A0R3MDA2_9BRAD|nr:tyrosine-type recombinase/integrase [Bradyrhizobium retamae]KRR15813.1 hypothetical protein CQ13_13905 [Bradyrhizobium retamae]